MTIYSAKFRVIRIIIFAFLTVLWVASAKSEEKSSSYPEVGLTFGGILQPSIGYWWGQKGVRVSGMYLREDKNEFHINLGYLLSDSGKVQRSINLLTSWVVGSDPGADYDYAATGVAYGINYQGFFLELGLGIPWKDDIGNVDDDPVVPVGYFGYIHRFKSK